MTTPLPTPLALNVAVGSQFVWTYVLPLNADGSVQNITDDIFEFSIRTDPAQLSSTPPLISVNSTSSTSSGTITVTLATATLVITVTATAMAALSQQPYYYTLWENQGLATAQALVAGTMFAGNIAAP